MPFISLVTIKDNVTITGHDKYPNSVDGSCYYYNPSSTDPKIILNNPPTGTYIYGNSVGTYMQIDLSTKYCMLSYSFVTSDWRPSSFTFKGTNDLSSWEAILDEHDNYNYESSSCSRFFNFTIAKPQSFRYYRFKLKDNGGSASTRKNSFMINAFDAILSTTLNGAQNKRKCTTATSLWFRRSTFIVTLIISY